MGEMYYEYVTVENRHLGYSGQCTGEIFQLNLNHTRCTTLDEMYQTKGSGPGG